MTIKQLQQVIEAFFETTAKDPTEALEASNEIFDTAARFAKQGMPGDLAWVSALHCFIVAQTVKCEPKDIVVTKKPPVTGLRIVPNVDPENI